MFRFVFAFVGFMSTLSVCVGLSTHSVVRMPANVSLQQQGPTATTTFATSSSLKFASSAHDGFHLSRHLPFVWSAIFVGVGSFLRLCGVRGNAIDSEARCATARWMIYAGAFMVLGMVHSAVIPTAYNLALKSGHSQSAGSFSGCLIGVVMVGTLVGISVATSLRYVGVSLDRLLQVGVALSLGGSLWLVQVIDGHSCPTIPLVIALVMQGLGVGFVDTGGEMWLSQLVSDDPNFQESVFLLFYAWLFFGQSIVGMMLTPIVETLHLFPSMSVEAMAPALMAVLLAALFAVQLVILPSEEETAVCLQSRNSSCSSIGSNASHPNICLSDGACVDTSVEHSNILKETTRIEVVNTATGDRWFVFTAFLETFIMTSSMSVVECGNTFIFQNELHWDVSLIGFVMGCCGIAVLCSIMLQRLFQESVEVTWRITALLFAHFVGVGFLALPCLQLADLAVCNIIADVLIFFSTYPRHAVTEASILACDSVGSLEGRTFVMLHCIYLAYVAMPFITRLVIAYGGQTAMVALHFSLLCASCCMYTVGIFPHLRRLNSEAALKTTPH